MTYAGLRPTDLESVLAATGERKGLLVTSVPEAFKQGDRESWEQDRY